MGETTAGGSIVIQRSGIAGGSIPPIADDAGKRGEGLLRCFHFKSDTKTWTFYDNEVEDDSALKWLPFG